MSNEINGFYAAYMSGAAGQGFSLLAFRNGKIIGADAVGAKYEGQYTVEKNKNYRMVVNITLPANMPLIQGGATGPEGDKHTLIFELPFDFLIRDFIRVEGKHGPVNVKLVKLSDLND